MHEGNQNRGLRVVLGLAGFVLVVAGFRAAAELILPILVALFLALLAVPPMRRLERHGVPSVLAMTIVVTAATMFVLLISIVIGRSITEFQDALPFYQARLNEIFVDAVAWLSGRGVEIDTATIISRLDSGSIMRLVGNTVSGLLAALSNVVLVMLTMVFMLLEAQSLAGKIRAAMGNPDADLSEFSTAAQRVQKYLAIKAWVSLVTGLLVAILCAACGVDFPLLWALIAFLFNFVPNIGSIIAAVPAVLLTLVVHGPGRALIVSLGYLAINMVLGNIIEPRFMGQRLGLSTLVVFLSMLFWGWVWGPLGMLLSVPLTVILKILLEHSDDFRWLSVLLGPGGEPPAR